MKKMVFEVVVNNAPSTTVTNSVKFLSQHVRIILHNYSVASCHLSLVPLFGDYIIIRGLYAPNGGVSTYEHSHVSML